MLRRPRLLGYPTDSSLLGDGVRVLIRTMKKITAIAGGAGAIPVTQSVADRVRDRRLARDACEMLLLSASTRGLLLFWRTARRSSALYC